MKLKFWDRILAALTGLIILLMGILLFIFGVSIFPMKVDLSVLNGPFTVWQRVGMIAVAVVLVLLGLHGLWLLFRRRSDKGFIMQHTDLGDMSISMNALETMVHKCVDQHEELTVKSTRIFRVKSGIVVEIRIILENGINIPLTVNALQKQIKQYITSCSGVEVHEVRVLVETNITRKPGKPHDLIMDARKTEPPANAHVEPIYATPAPETKPDDPQEPVVIFEEPAFEERKTVAQELNAMKEPEAAQEPIEERTDEPQWEETVAEQAQIEQPEENGHVEEKDEEDEENGAAE